MDMVHTCSSVQLLLVLVQVIMCVSVPLWLLPYSGLSKNRLITKYFFDGYAIFMVSVFLYVKLYVRTSQEDYPNFCSLETQIQVCFVVASILCVNWDISEGITRLKCPGVLVTLPSYKAKTWTSCWRCSVYRLLCKNLALRWFLRVLLWDSYPSQTLMIPWDVSRNLRE